jgi:DNA-binding cell septation regulator SpoVG
MPETRDLDTRIRELVARAVADAPRAPDIDPSVLPEIEPSPDRRRWWIGGGAAILAAAALVTALLLVGDTDDTVSTPATEPTTTPTTAPETPTAPPSTTPSATNGDDVILTVGPDGVVEHRGGQTRTLTSEPMVMALDAGDGRVIVQRHAGHGEGRGWTDADTAPLVLAEDGSLTSLFGTVDWDGGVVLHDIEVVDGRRLLLFSLQVAMANPDTANETLYVVDLESGERTQIDQVGGWEAGTGRLHLATNGLIAGQFQAEATHGPLFRAVPASPAEQLLASASPAPLQLEESYSDCTDCPNAFTVSPDGTKVAWLDGGELVVVELLAAGAGPEQRFTLDPAVGSGNVRDLDFDPTRFVLSYWPGEATPAPVMLLAGDPSGDPEALEGVAATLGPAAPTRSDTSPTTTVPPPSSPEGDANFVTAGRAGVVEHSGTESRTLTTEPMVMALDAGDGRVIVQRRSGDGAGQGWTDAETAPLLLGADGSLRPLFDTVDWDGGVVLHDIEVVAGRRLLLFSLQVAMNVNPEAADETLYVVDLDTQERTEVAAGIGGWEEGTGRLHLATTGLIVGEWGRGVDHGIFIDDVPIRGQASALPTPADLGLEETYGDCNDCPYGFAVAPDGVTFAWIDGDELVVHVLNEQSDDERIALRSSLGCCGSLDDMQGTDSFLWSTETWVEPPQVPVRIDGDGTVTPLEGAVATASPGGSSPP